VLPLAVVTTAGEDRNADGAVDPALDGARLFEDSVAVALLPEADNAFGADNGGEGTVSVRVEDSLDDGEFEDRPLGCRELSEDARDMLGLGTLGNGSEGGGELEPNPTRLDSVEEADVDGDLEGFEGDVEVGADDDRVAAIDCPGVEEAGKLAPPIDDPAAAVAVSIRESDAARALSLDGAVTFESWTVAFPAGLIGDVCAAFGTTSHDACFVLDTAVPESGCFPPGVSDGFKVAL